MASGCAERIRQLDGTDHAQKGHKIEPSSTEKCRESGAFNVLHTHITLLPHSPNRQDSNKRLSSLSRVVFLYAFSDQSCEAHALAVSLAQGTDSTRVRLGREYAH